MSTQEKLDKLVVFMEKNMTHIELDGFIKVHKLSAAGVAIPECITKGLFDKEQWTSQPNTMCNAISPVFPEDQTRLSICQMVLQELVNAWPN